MFKAGASAVEITPDRNLDLTGFIARENPMTGVLNPIYARSLYLEGQDGGALCLISLDILAFDNARSRKVEALIADRLEIPEERVLIASIHTHSAPAAINLRQCGSIDADWLLSLESNVLEAASAAAAFAEDAQLFLSSGEALQWRRNRRIPRPIENSGLGLLQARAPNGVPLATAAFYACHPVSLGPCNRMVSPDYPAWLINAMEPEMGIGLFFLPPAGNVDPMKMGDPGFTAKMGRGLAEKARQLAREARIINAQSIAAVVRDIFFEYDPPPSTAELRRIVEKADIELARIGMNAVARREKKALKEWAVELLDAVERDRVPMGVECRLAVYRIGDLIIAALGAEVFVEFGSDLKRKFPHTELLCISCARGNVGYIPEPSYFGKGYYETDMAYKFYGLLRPCEGAYNLILENITEMIEKLSVASFDDGNE